MIRLVLDQGLPRSTVRLLSESGWDVVHVADIGLHRAADSEILAYARREHRVCVTLDADFHAHLAVGGVESPSTIRVRIEGLNGPALAGLLKRVWPIIADAVEQGVMVTITEHSIRLRRLPVRRGSME